MPLIPKGPLPKQAQEENRGGGTGWAALGSPGRYSRGGRVKDPV